MRNLLLFVMALLIGACAGGASLPITQAPATSGLASSAAEDAGDYRLGVADKIRVIVFNETALSNEFAVNANGSISFPLIGDVKAAGRTPSDVRAEIERRLADGYLRDPRVSIDVLTFRPFYILGEVNKPGEYPYATGLSALNAIATAGGYTYRADRKRVFVKRVGEAAEQAAPPTVAIRPGDTIRVGERYF